MIGLIDIEPEIINTALMQIAYHYKDLGETVEWALPLEYDKYDKLFCSSLFDYTDKSQIPKRAVCGGTGFDLTTTLPFDCAYDYSIYPGCDYSILWFSRGCIRKCPYCVVWKKEGKIRPVTIKSLNPNGNYIVVQDNNFFANPQWLNAVIFLQTVGQPIDFQGVDVRTLDKNKCIILSRLKHYKRIKIAWDNPNDDITEKLKLIVKHITPRSLMCYVLIGYWSTPEKDLYRVEKLREFGILPFVMKYDVSDPYESNFARWVNRPEIFNSCKWEDYRRTDICK